MAGFKYTPDDSGLAELGRSAGVGTACLTAAQAGVQFASSDDPHGAYEARRSDVTAGWSNEVRAGAVVEEVEEGDGAKRRTLVRTVPVIES